MSYLTLAKEACIRKTVERSVFIAHAREVKDETAARRFLAEVRAAVPEAAHHCYAYRLGTEKTEIAHYSDDGEPSGTAGRPILGAMRAAGVTNAMIVVARIFGGKKLGIPGLIEAYRSAAAEAIAAAGTRLRTPCSTLEFALPYDRLAAIRRLASAHGAEELHASYGEHVLLRLRIPKEDEPRFLRDLAGYGLAPSAVLEEDA